MALTKAHNRMIAGAPVTPAMFGAVGDGSTDDIVAIQAAWDFASANSVPCDMEGKEYNCSTTLNTSSNLTVLGEYATLYITDYTPVGGFINNVVFGDVNARVQENIYIEKLIVDGSKLPASSSQNLNLLGFARGASNVRIVDCIGRKIRDGGGGGTGGGAFGVEQGGENISFINCTAEDCYRGFRIAGIPGNHDDDAAESKRAINIRVSNFTARRCGTAVFAHSVGHQGDDQSDLSIFDCIFDGLYIEDCGHYAWREFDFAVYPLIPAQKTGAINLGGAQNVRFRGVRVKINSGYPQAFTDWLGRTGYPTSGNYIGAGLSGRIGAIVWGWGRNVVFEDISIDGSFECVWKCARAIVFGDLATVSPTDGISGTVSQVVFESVRYVRPGTYNYIFDGQDGLDNEGMSAVIRMKPSSNPSLGIVGPNGTAGLSNVRIEFISNQGKTQTGDVVEWLDFGNSRPTSPNVSFSLGGFDLGGGYSGIGSRNGSTYKPSAGILRTSRDTSLVAPHLAFYNTNGLVGTISSNGSSTVYATASDGRRKENFQDFGGEHILKSVDFYNFDWRVDGDNDYGVIAQELKEVYPKAVVYDAEADLYSVDYSKLIPVLGKALQECLERVNSLEAQLGG